MVQVTGASARGLGQRLADHTLARAKRVLRGRLQLSLDGMCNWYLRAAVDRRPFTIISNNCWGGDVYQALRMPYQSPFVGLFVWPECYLRLLSDLHRAIHSPLGFKTESRHTEINVLREARGWAYPIGVIGDDVELHFLHYGSACEAREKWNRRLERARWDDESVFVKFCDSDNPTAQQLCGFDRLPFSHKVCFVRCPYPQFPSAVCIAASEAVRRDLGLFRATQRHFNIAAWLNGATGLPQNTYRLVAAARAAMSRITQGAIG